MGARVELPRGTITWTIASGVTVTSLRKLGAVEALQALGLDDAAVSLTMGDLDAARVQWLRWKDGA